MKSQFKIILISAILFSVCHLGFAQWEGPGVNGSGNIYIQDSKVGIGVTDPKETLHINGPIRGNQSGALRIRSNYGYVDIGSKNSNWAHFQTDRARIFLQRKVALGEGILASHDTKNLIFNTGMTSSSTGNTRMTILNSNGFVGIGTETPEGTLHINRNATVGRWGQMDLSKAGLRVQDNSFSMYIDGNTLFTDGIMHIGSFGNYDFTIGTNDVERVKVSADGNVGIGTTTPLAKLQVKQSNDNGFRLERDGHDLYELRLQGNTGLQILNKTDSRREMTFAGNGNIGIGTMAPDYTLEVEKNNAGNNVEYLLGAFNHSGNAGGVYMGYVGDGTDAKKAVIRSGGNINLNLGTTAYKTAMTIRNSTGAVGIGTELPNEALDVIGNVKATAFLNSAGESIINTIWKGASNDNDLIHRDGSIILGGNSVMGNYGSNWKFLELQDEGIISIGPSVTDRLQLVHSSFGSSIGSQKTMVLSGNDGLNFQTNGDWQNNKMTITQEGNVGIGTENPTNKLEVNGIIRSREVLVQASPWPDYVFAPEYNLLSLEETAQFIEDNHHLPGIPSAAEVAANGVAVGDMNARLLEKIEELTLHLIKQEQRLEQLDQNNLELRNTVSELQTQLKEQHNNED
ncbi:MAG: hypothetical protein R8G66_16405 [Cytophagales bacterium]|nr:hypothetical protein [Cytophagales bacterium]